MRTAFYGLALAGISSLQPGSAPGLKIVTRHTYERMETETIQYVDATRKRVEHRTVLPRDAVGGASIQITRCDRRARFMLDPDQRTYFKAPLESDVFSRRRLSRPVATGDAARPPVEWQVETTTVDTGERKTMFGLTARRVITTRTETRAGDPHPRVRTTTDGWYVDLETDLPCETRPDDVFAHGFVVSGTRRVPPDPISVTFKKIGAPERGFPIQTTAIREQRESAAPAVGGILTTRTTLVTGISRVPLDPALFEIPAGFRRADGFAAWVADRVYSAWRAVTRAAFSLF